MDFLLVKHWTPKIPHIKLECVDLCGLGSVGGLSDPHRVPAPRKKACFTTQTTFSRVKEVRQEYYYFYHVLHTELLVRYLKQRLQIHPEHASSMFRMDLYA
jgi:hypothetical protein